MNCCEKFIKCVVIYILYLYKLFGWRFEWYFDVFMIVIDISVCTCREIWWVHIYWETRTFILIKWWDHKLIYLLTVVVDLDWFVYMRLVVCIRSCLRLWKFWVINFESKMWIRSIENMYFIKFWRIKTPNFLSVNIYIKFNKEIITFINTF